MLENGSGFGDFFLIEEQLAGGGKALKAISPWCILDVQQGGLKHNGKITTALNGVSREINYSGMKFEELLLALSKARRDSAAEVLGAAMAGKISDTGMDGIVRLLESKFGKSIEEACAIEADKAVNATLDRVADAVVETVKRKK